MNMDVCRLFAWRPAAWKQRVQFHIVISAAVRHQEDSDKPPPAENGKADNDASAE